MKERSYLSLDYSNGGFYESLREPKQGFAEYVTSKGNITYRKEYNFVEGIFKHIGIRNKDWGTVFTITLEDDFSIYEIQINLTDTRGNFDDTFLGSFLNRLPYVNVGDDIRITPYNFVPKDNKYPIKGISVRNKGVKLDSYYKFSYYPKGSEKLVEGDIPAKKWVKNRLTGKNTIDPTSQSNVNKFYEDLVLEQQERVGFETVNGSEEGGGVPMVKESLSSTSATPTGDSSPKDVPDAMPKASPDDTLPAKEENKDTNKEEEGEEEWGDDLPF